MEGEPQKRYLVPFIARKRFFLATTPREMYLVPLMAVNEF
jgi:hypothetical protein